MPYFTPAAARHRSYIAASSCAFNTHAPKLSSSSGVRGGQLACTSAGGCGGGTGYRRVEQPDSIRTAAAVAVNRTLNDFALDLLANGDMLDLDGVDDGCRGRGACGRSLSHQPLFVRLARFLAGLPGLQTQPVRAGDGRRSRQRAQYGAVHASPGLYVTTPPAKCAVSTWLRGRSATKLMCTHVPSQINWSKRISPLRCIR